MSWWKGDGAARPHLGKLCMPVLVGNGVADVMVPAEHSFAIVQKASRAKLLLYPDAGHAFLFERFVSAKSLAKKRTSGGSGRTPPTRNSPLADLLAFQFNGGLVGIFVAAAIGMATFGSVSVAGLVLRAGYHAPWPKARAGSPGSISRRIYGDDPRTWQNRARIGFARFCRFAPTKAL